MRRLPVVILVMVAVLVAVVTGCSGAHRYDGRLVAADSLMRNDPDSALALLEALPTASLTTDGDRAYHGLLISQARYKAYVVATSDSDINRALSYYRAHSREREKLTRAYIYKGAVMEELGHPDSAMYYYKSAEATASPDDYFNLGYCKMRMGSLYNDYYSMNGREIEKYEEAIHYFRMSCDTAYLLTAMNNLACFYRDSKPKEAETLLMQASEIAISINDTNKLNYCKSALTLLFFYQERYEEAQQLIRQVIANPNLILGSDFFFSAANVYSRLGLRDSALLFLNYAKQISDDSDFKRINYLYSLSELALADGDTITYLRLSQESEFIADSLKSNVEKLIIYNVDQEYDKEVAKSIKKKQVLTKWLSIAMLIMSFVMLIVILLVHYRKSHRYDQLVNELKQEAIEANSQQSFGFKPAITDQHLRNFVNEHTAMMRDVIEECYHAPTSILSKNIQKIIKYQEKNKDAWVNLFPYIDMENNNIITETQKNFPQLDEKEIMMVALTAMGYSCAQIAIILGYSSAQGITTIRNRVAKKMGINCRLVEYVEKFKTIQ